MASRPGASARPQVASGFEESRLGVEGGFEEVGMVEEVGGLDQRGEREA